jgi:hypothetical protein
VQVPDLRKCSFLGIEASTSPERTESAAHQFSSVAAEGSSNWSDLHGRSGSQSGNSPHGASVSGWTPNSGRRQDAGKWKWLPRRLPARHRCGG